MKRIQLTQGQFAKVSDEDFEEINQYKWYALWCDGTQTFYAVRQLPTTDGKRCMVRMHTVISNAPKGMDTDHINGDTLDNQRDNLRVCSHAENMRNRPKQRNNTSGYKGVSFNKKLKKWVAFISVNQKKKFLGYFDSPELAAKRYDTEAREQFREYAQFNFIYTQKKGR